MTLSFGRLHPAQPTEQRWGAFAGALYRDFGFRWPAAILAGPPHNREAALPIVKYRMRGFGLRQLRIVGITSAGKFVSELRATGIGLLGSGVLKGTLRSEDGTVGVATVGPVEGPTVVCIKGALASLQDAVTEPVAVVLGEVRAADSSRVLRLVALRRSVATREGDAYILDETGEAVVHIPRLDCSWAEQVASRFGFGRAKVGRFLESAALRLREVPDQLALVFLLACYFHHLEPAFNTDWPGG